MKESSLVVQDAVPDADWGAPQVIRPEKTSRNLLHSVLVAISLAVVVLSLQWWNGAYQSELGAHPDESAHYVTGLALHDYIVQGRGTDPMAFVVRFYAHYPKVALGQWPPVLYILEAAWALVFPSSVPSLLVLMALLSVATGLLLSHAVSRQHPFPVGLTAGLLLVANPSFTRNSAFIMADVLVSLCMLAAALAFSRYIDSDGRAKYAVLFGLVCCAAFLSKGSALGLFIVPLAAVVLSANYRMVRRKSFWIAPVLVILLCGPWYLKTKGLSVDSWNHHGFTLGYVQEALRFYSGILYSTLGWFGLTLSVIGILSYLANRRRDSRNGDSSPAAMIGLIAAVAFVLLAIQTGMEERYILPALAPFIFFAVEGAWYCVQQTARRFPRLLQYRTVACSVLLLLALCLAFKPTPKHYSGMLQIASSILGDPSPDYPAVLVVSDPGGEGMFVADMASHRTESMATVIRGTKILAEMNWPGTEYESPYHTTTELLNRLDELPLVYVLVDESVPTQRLAPHQILLQQTIAQNTAKFLPLGDFSVTREGISYPNSAHLYRFVHTRTPSRVLRFKTHGSRQIEEVVPLLKQ